MERKCAWDFKGENKYKAHVKKPTITVVACEIKITQEKKIAAKGFHVNTALTTYEIQIYSGSYQV